MGRIENDTIRFCFAVVVSLLLFTSCIYRPFIIGPEVGIKEVTYYPKYFCSGETIHFSYEGVNINKLQIKKADGSILLEMLGESGSNKTPPMRAEWLPLSVKGFSDYGNRTQSLEGKIINIDDPTWAGPYWSVREMREGEPSLDHIATVEEWDTETSSIVNVKIYEVYQNFTGFAWQFPLMEFSTRAALLSTRNDGNETLTFGLPGGNTQLSPGQTASIANYPYPPFVIYAQYSSPRKKLIAIQKGEYTKPENEHFSYQNLYEETKYPLSLELICR